MTVAEVLSAIEAELTRQAAEWADLEAQNYPKKFPDLTPCSWAWEFLRRNREYWEDWSEVEEARERLRREGAPVRVTASQMVKRSRGLTEEEQRSRQDLAGSETSCGLKWRVLDLADPRSRRAPNFIESSEPVTEIDPTAPAAQYGSILRFGVPDQTSPAGDDNLTVAEAILAKRLDTVHLLPGEIAVQPFDLASPLAPQVRRTRQALKAVQRALKVEGVFDLHEPRIRDQFLSFYLRVLDARLCDARLADIADAFEFHDPVPLDEKKVSDRLHAAKKLTWPPGYTALLRRWQPS